MKWHRNNGTFSAPLQIYIISSKTSLSMLLPTKGAALHSVYIMLISMLLLGSASPSTPIRLMQILNSTASSNFTLASYNPRLMNEQWASNRHRMLTGEMTARERELYVSGNKAPIFIIGTMKGWRNNAWVQFRFYSRLLWSKFDEFDAIQLTVGSHRRHDRAVGAAHTTSPHTQGQTPRSARHRYQRKWPGFKAHHHLWN